MISQSWSKPFISYLTQRRVNHVCRIITRHGSLESSIEAIRLGVQDYIQKPFDTEFLLASVKKCFTAKVERQHQERLVEQLESSLKQLKDLLGVTTPALPDRQIVSPCARGSWLIGNTARSGAGKPALTSPPRRAKRWVSFSKNRVGC